MKILILHGPNLNLLGVRETGVYGKATLDEINQALHDEANRWDVKLTCIQSNSEGELVDHIQGARKEVHGILINPGAYTHTSIAIRDALLAVNLPTVEVHMSNPHSREIFRHKSYIEDIVVGRVTGFQKNSYILGLKGLIETLNQGENREAMRRQ